MFEREVTDTLFVRRWGIVRTLMPQSVAEHSFLVAHYANDIAVYLGLRPELHLSLLQYALWHDVDEVFTGDLPGPNKRGLLDAIGPEAADKWNAKLRCWTFDTFSNYDQRAGGLAPPDDAYIVKLILKTADWLEASVRMATEYQMGNNCAARHIVPNKVGALETLHLLIEAYFNTKVNLENLPLNNSPADDAYFFLSGKIDDCVTAARSGQSKGPFITREDASRTYHDACVDTRQ